MHRVLVLGGSGLVGKAVINELNKDNKFQVYATYFQNPIELLEKNRSFKLNIKDSDSISCLLNKIKPQSVVSCLRGDYDKQLNLHRKIAEYLKDNDGSMYFFSTTNVFDGDLSRPHYENDLPNSETDYGKYKIECENKLLEILQDRACILRIPQVWGKVSPRMRELLDSLNNNKNITVYPKLFLNTNTDVMVAKQLRYIIENNLKGIFHLASEDVIGYKEFYPELIRNLGFNNAKIEENFEEEGYFVLLTKRNNEFPENLRFTIKAVINYLTK